MSFVWLTLAIAFEVAGTTCMKLSTGLTKLSPTFAMLVLYIFSLLALTLALKKMEVSVAYAVWSGLGTALITLVGVFLFRESLSVVKLAAIGMIIGGVVLLNLCGNPH